MAKIIITKENMMARLSSEKFDSPDKFLEELKSIATTNSKGNKPPDKLPIAPKPKLTRTYSFLKEIVKTEETYEDNLRSIVEDYQSYLYNKVPENFKDEVAYIFGNINEIYKKEQEFLNLLKVNNKSVNGILNVILNSSDLFNLYIDYAQNKIKADIYLKKYEELIERKSEELNDYTGLLTHLTSPLTRLSKYRVMLESIKEEVVLESSKKKYDEAQTYLSSILKKCDDVVAVALMQKCQLDLSKQGAIIMRGKFNVIRPRKFSCMLFLFENIIVFTELKNRENEFHYVDSIEMNDLNITNADIGTPIFSLTDFRRLKTFNEVYAIYELEAQNIEEKNKWISFLENKLWDQLKKAKECQKRNSDHDELPRKDQNLGKSKFYLGKSRFYLGSAVDEDTNFK